MSGEIDILPPSPHQVVEATKLVTLRSGGTLPERPLSLLPSGRWWVFIPGSGEATTMVNDHQLYWPRGVWFAVEDKHFHVLKETDFPMQWYDGYDLCEKHITTRQPPTRSGTEYRVIEARVIHKGIQPMDDPTHDGRRRTPRTYLPGT